MSGHYCLECGTPMEIRRVEDRPREVCPACGYIHYVHLKVGAGVIIEQDGKLLLAQRAHDPWNGDWNIPAGYVEVDEQPYQAAVREAKEELGVDVAIKKLLGVYQFDDDPRGNGLLVLYRAGIVGGEVRFNFETQDMRYFGPEEIPDNLALGAHDQVIHDWRDGKFDG